MGVTVVVSCGRACHRVTLVHCASGAAFSAHTDHEGKAKFKNLPPGAYDVFVDGKYVGRKYYPGGHVIWYVPCPGSHPA